MRIRIRAFAFLATVVVVLSSSFVHAQQNTRPSVVVVDVGRVFKEHTRFNREMLAMKDRVAAYETVVRGKQEQIQAMAAQAQKAGAGSEQYKQLERQAATAMSDLRVDMGLKKKEFMEEEARLYYDVYAEVTRTIAQFADANGIRVVLRYNSEPIDKSDRNSVLQGINNNVVFQRDLDITNFIVEQVNRGSGPAGQGINKSRPALPPSAPRQP